MNNRNQNQRNSFDGRAVRAVTLRPPATLRTGRYILVPAFAGMRLTHALARHGESEARRHIPDSFTVEVQPSHMLGRSRCTR